VRRAVLAAAVLGSAAILIVLVLELTYAKPHLASTNSRVIASGFGVVLKPGRQWCQAQEYVPTDAAKLRMFTQPVGTKVEQPLRVTLRGDDGAVVMRRALPAAAISSPLFVQLPPRSHDIYHGHLCLLDTGTAPMSFAGNLTSDQPQSPGAFNIRGQRQSNEIRADYFRAGKESWLDLGSVIARRFALFKPGWVGAWTLWAGLGVMLAVAATGIAVMVRGALRS
jgi:hypothetical protein